MNVYTIYADIKKGVKPIDFVEGMSAFLESLPQCKKFRITRMKLGFRSKNIGEWRVDMEFESMQDLDDAMKRVLYNKNTIDKHIHFEQFVDAESLDHFLYRDYPDDV